MPANKIPIVKKRTKKFARYHSDRYHRLANSTHRKPRGIDSAIRRRFRGRPALPKIGYGSNKKTKHLMPNGLRRLVVSNPKDVELLLMHNGSYAAEVAHNVSARKRIDILEKAKVLGVKVTNANARVRSEEA